MTDDLIEYLSQLMPTAPADCAGCGLEREASTMTIREGRAYCSEDCADRALALLRKPQPKGVRLNGWDI
jgi:hypothetical protein